MKTISLTFIFLTIFSMLVIPVGASSRVDAQADDGDTVGLSSIVIDDADNVYALWVDEGDPAGPSLYFSQQDANSGVWGVGQPVAIGTIAAGSRPSLALGGTGFLHAAWVDVQNGAYDLYYANRAVSGGAWSIPVKINDGDGQVWSPALTADVTDNVYAVWRDSRDGAGVENETYIYANKRPAGGAWGADVRISNSDAPKDRAAPALAVYDDTLHLTWADFREGNGDIYYDTIATNDPIWNSGGAYNTFNQRVNPDDDGVEQTAPAIGIDSSGMVYVAWADSVNVVDNDQNWDVYFSTLNQSGSWAAPQLLNDDTGSHYQGMPTLSADGLGYVWAGWMDGRDLESEYSWHIYGTKLHQGIPIWEANQRISDDTPSASRERPLAAAGITGDAHFIWRDFRDGNPHLYAAFFAGPPILNSVEPETGNDDIATAVALTGANFTTPLTVTLGITTLSILAATSDVITVTVPAGLEPTIYDVTVINADGQSVTLTDAFTIIHVNTPPVAVDNNYITNKDTPLIVDTVGILGNDSDVEGDLLTAMLDSTTTNGTLKLNLDGSFVYTPTANFHGTDSFTYYATDGQDNSNIAVVIITIVENIKSIFLPMITNGG